MKTAIPLAGLLLISVSAWQDKPAAPAETGYRTDPRAIQHGRAVFDRYCAACHNFESAEIGPNLAGVTAETSKKWLAAFIRNPQEVIASGDPRAAQLLKQYKAVMPPFATLAADELEDVLAYMNTFSADVTEKDAAKTAEALADPLPARIPMSDLTLVLERVLTMPASAAESPVTRINKMLAVGTAAGERLFIHDLRGKLYEIRGNRPHVYFDLAAQLPRFIHVPGLGTGFGSFAFHPEFSRTGLLYTTHTEPAGAAAADFAIAAPTPVRLQWVLSEWKTGDSSASAFSGTRRELLRADMYSQIHGFQEVTFNPLAAAGDADYGMLYLAVGDGGAGVTKYWSTCCARGVWGSVLRIDPAATDSRNGRYGIPRTNPHVKPSDVPPEVWVRGFRNPHRITWDVSGSRKMFITDIGQHTIEEVNVGVAGAHYGWPQREGTFRLDVPANPKAVYPRPPRDPLPFVYPAAQYDHDEGAAVSGGFVYGGDAIPLLRGKYVFGDITSGRVFFAEVARMEPNQQAPIHQFSIEVDGQKTTLESLTKHKRVDLRFGQDRKGDLYIFTKADGAVWKVVGCRRG